ncbi:hypothetical protein [uncultured Gilvimarinus sp.]|uniref:hypothetical protein n=1 Tax=uncultured Gilvimarinus sp. TaxID=1689143 RepID=UPI0030DBB70A
MNKPLMALCLLLVITAGLWFALDTGTLNTTAENPSPNTATNAPGSGKIAPSAATTGHSALSDNVNPEPKAADTAANKTAQATTPLAERLSKMQSRRPDRIFDPAEVRAAVQRDSAWSNETPDNLDDLPLDAEALNDGRQIISFDPLKLETLMPGDQVSVNIDETGEQYTVNINRTEKHDYDSISWYGTINGNDGQTYQVSFTQSDTLTLGGLDTPDGNYQLQAHGDAGWIASSASLFKVPEGQTDAIIPADVKPQPVPIAH